ncbi:FAD-dependent oxidoreductase [Porphyrobacter sp. SLTP]|uniref:FAD-dependent oxidoreductase n=1 Tax=Porphyrobacter sp. SLTP TaxID=2683266 RepID=UPI001413559B|nr:FAD-dependent oxidoreductase [Porphyrobacter sp. SLTP]NBB25577.1 FAD-dependent oxidoreductase [Porphyrobacter sp. SLTP]
MMTRQNASAGAETVMLLVGGGHAHVAVLADWAKRGAPAGVRTVLLTPERHLRYSGMVPGWIAGQHAQDDGLVDLAALAARAGVALVLDRCTGLDPDAQLVRTAAGEAIRFDIASFDTGGEGQAAKLLGDDPRLIDVRPIGAFVDRLAALGPLTRIVVVGGGAGGVELAFALRNRAGVSLPPEVTLAAGRAGLLPGFAPAVQARAAQTLAREGIVVLAADARFAGGAIVAGEQSLEPADCIIAATGSAAPAWVRASGIATDAVGFLAVDAHQRSTSHPHIFAAGDVAARTDRPLAHSGVHAVFAGPVLAANLRAVLAGEAPRRTYRPRWNNLYLMNTGDGSAIASYGPLAAEGRWVLALKHWIDKRWIAQYVRLAQMA